MEIENIFNLYPVWDSICKSLSNKDKINFCLATRTLDSLFVKSSKNCDFNLRNLIFDSACETLSEDILSTLNDEDWKTISILRHQNSSDSFIRKFSDRLNWFYLNNLSENIIEEFPNKVDWRSISK